MEPPLLRAYVRTLYGAQLELSSRREKILTSPDSFLDAGANIPVGGPGLAQGSVLAKLALPQGPIYNLTPPAGALALGGTYTLNGGGGTQIGPFTIAATLPSSFAVTNWDTITAVNRATPLTLNWAGSGFDTVIIDVQGMTSANSTNDNVAVSCVVQGSLGTFTDSHGCARVVARHQHRAVVGAGNHICRGHIIGGFEYLAKLYAELGGGRFGELWQFLPVPRREQKFAKQGSSVDTFDRV